uniref:Dihydrodipicolinate reductase n=1 Tax=Cacopsylla melanoneura TaxID=428564 RepID=A0A8D8XBW0_9HEMI
MIKIFIFGITGKMGKSILNYLKLNKNFVLLGGINKKNFFKFFFFLKKKKKKKKQQPFIERIYIRAFFYFIILFVLLLSDQNILHGFNILNMTKRRRFFCYYVLVGTYMHFFSPFK